MSKQDHPPLTTPNEVVEIHDKTGLQVAESSTTPTQPYILPPTHFLSLSRPSTSTTSPSTSANESVVPSFPFADFHVNGNTTNPILTTFHNDDSFTSPFPTGPTYSAGAPDTTTLAAHDFDVDNRTGFMPPDPPIARLPTPWDLWESILDDAIQRRLQLSEKRGLTNEEKEESEGWRRRVRELPIKPISQSLTSSETLLRRAHLVLAWITHFYIHTLPPTSTIRIPPPITIPLLQICDELQLPPVLTYSDDVLYNWNSIPIPINDNDTSPSQSPPPPPASWSWTSPGIPPFPSLRTNTTFTSTPDESQFYLTSARMEFRGVEALTLMRDMMDEMFVSDDIAIRRVTGSLVRMKEVVGEMKGLLMGVRDGVDVETFYREIRPWFRGEDSVDKEGRREWVFEGLDEWNEGVDEYNLLQLQLQLDAGAEEGSRTPTQTTTPHPNPHPSQPPLFLKRKKLVKPTDLSGASAGQSTLIHALDIFLGVRSATKEKEGLVMKMQKYMPRYHRAFLSHLMSTKRTLRQFVLDVIGEEEGGDYHDVDGRADDAGYLGESETDGVGGWDTDSIGKEEKRALKDAYNGAVTALKELRDGHMVIVAQYILAPARRYAAELKVPEDSDGGRAGEEELKMNVGAGEEKLKMSVGDGEGVAGEKSVRAKGTGGTDVVRFLKGVRDLTAGTVISDVR